MTRKLFVLCVAVMLTMAAGTAMADNIMNRFGVTGRIGFIVPSDSDDVITGVVVGTKTDFIGGGGFIYGLTNNIATELDITHAGFDSDEGIDFNTTSISFGLQYRFLNLPVRKLVPYAGGGLDILLNDASGGRSVDNVVGVHVSGGIDYFVQREFALTAEMKGVIAPDADIRNFNNNKVGDFDPTYFSMTFGVRYFFN